MTKRRKILIAVLVAVLVAAGGFAAVLLHDRGAAYPCEEKNAIAMGTVISMKLYHTDEADLTPGALQVIDALEDTISWRRETSPVAKLNRSGRCENTVVAEVIRQCAPISDATNGAFDLSVGKVSTLWDFGGENERLPKKEEILAALPFVDYKTIRVADAAVTCGNGQQMDLGAVGKGLACDMVKTYLQKAGVQGAVVSVGGSICAFGCRDKAGTPWRVAVKDPLRTERLLGVIRMKEGFVSTSGDYEKFFEQDGSRYFHILDATTGYPATSGLKSVTVVCNNGMLSDALSTACFLLGEENSKPLLETYGAAAIFVDDSGSISTVGDVDFEVYES